MDVDVDPDLSSKSAENGVHDTVAPDSADVQHAPPTGDALMPDDHVELASEQGDGVETAVGSRTDAPHEEANGLTGKGGTEKEEGAAAHSPKDGLLPLSSPFEPEQDARGETFTNTMLACILTDASPLARAVYPIVLLS